MELKAVSMKIQAKVGGITHTVSHPKLDSSTMMIGADVTHPPAQRGGFAGTPQASVAVTVAAINGSNNQFNECIRLQAGTQ
jgi:eukaryotic translation initiation factor 2C